MEGGFFCADINGSEIRRVCIRLQELSLEELGEKAMEFNNSHNGN